MSKERKLDEDGFNEDGFRTWELPKDKSLYDLAVGTEAEIVSADDEGFTLEVTDELYRCFDCNELIKEESFLINKTDKVENNRYVEVYKFFHEECGEGVTGLETFTKIRPPD